jgi:hypothetical protein
MERFGEFPGRLMSFGRDPILHFAMETERAPEQFLAVQRKWDVSLDIGDSCQYSDLLNPAFVCECWSKWLSAIGQWQTGVLEQPHYIPHVSVTYIGLLEMFNFLAHI